MLLSAVSVLVVAQSSSEISEGLMNNPVVLTSALQMWVVRFTHGENSLPSKYDARSEFTTHMEALKKVKIPYRYRESNHTPSVAQSMAWSLYRLSGPRCALLLHWHLNAYHDLGQSTV